MDQNITQTGTVHATLNYTVDNGIPPDYYFYEPDPSVKLNPPGTDLHEVEIRDGWARAESFDADREAAEEEQRKEEARARAEAEQAALEALKEENPEAYEKPVKADEESVEEGAEEGAEAPSEEE